MNVAERTRAPGAVWDVLCTVWREAGSDRVTMLAAGLAYYCIFGLLPALAAAAALWGQLGDVGAFQQMLHDSGDLFPAAAVPLVEQFITSVPQGFGGGVALAVNLAFAIWTAALAASALLGVLNAVYDVQESRPWLRRWTVAVAIGAGGIAWLFVAVAALALAPLVTSRLQAGLPVSLLWLRWPILVAVFTAGLALLLHVGPNRPRSPAVPLACGTAAGTMLCFAVSFGISGYVSHVGSFGRLYGSLAGVAVALLWFYGVALALLVGAEIDAVLTDRLSDKDGTPTAQGSDRPQSRGTSAGR